MNQTIKKYPAMTGFGHARPARSVSNDELSRFMETSDEWIRSRTGIERRNISETEDTEKLAEQAAFVVALRRGTPLTEEQKKLITPERSDIVTVYRELQARRWHAEDLQPLCAKLGEENTGKTLVAVTALEQVGLIAAVEKGGAKYLELVPAQGKKNLADAPILKCLEGM